MNDENVKVEQEPRQEAELATVVAPVSGTNAKGMLFTKGGALITCRDGQNRLLMLSTCEAFRADQQTLA